MLGNFLKNILKTMRLSLIIPAAITVYVIRSNRSVVTWWLALGGSLYAQFPYITFIMLCYYVENML